MSLAQKAGRAGLLLFARKMWGALVNIGVMAYLARTLDRADFGLVAISGVLISFVSVFAISGIGEYVVFYQKKEDEEEVVNAAFWLNLFLTLGVALVVLVVAPFWAKSYEDPRILNLVWLLLIGFVSSSLSAMPNALFRKELNYAPMIKVQTVFGTLFQLSQVLFAWLGFGVYALALPNAIVAPLLALTLFWVSGFRPRKDLGVIYWKKIFSYTKNVIGARVLGRFVNEGDTLLIGKLLGLEALGIYDLAFKLANLINGQLVPILTNISLPVFAKSSSDICVVRERYLKLSGILAFCVFPIFGLLIVLAPWLIELLYGTKWGEAVLPFQLLAVFAAFRTISSPTSGLFNALNRPDLGFYFTLFFTPVFLGSVYVGSQFGLIGVCVSVTLARVLGGGFLINQSVKLIELSWLSVFKKIYNPILASFTLTVLLLLIDFDKYGWLQLSLISLSYISIFLLFNLLTSSFSMSVFFQMLSNFHFWPKRYFK